MRNSKNDLKMMPKNKPSKHSRIQTPTNIKSQNLLEKARIMEEAGEQRRANLIARTSNKHS
jgi:hypothetical protein